MKTFRILSFIFFVYITLSQEQTEGEKRLRKLRDRQASAKGKIITLSPEDFKQYALQYPRPYDLVIFFTANTCKLCDQLKPEYQYMSSLYHQGSNPKQPVFFAYMNFNRQSSEVFDMFGFTSAPNLVVSKPYMAIVSEIQKKLYLQKFKWAISYSDGDVTTHKMLDFVNQRTGQNILYKPTFKTMITMFFGFIIIMGTGAFIFLKMRAVWTYWLVWFFGVIAIYITCVSGVVYDIIHNVPFVGRDKETGQALIFTGGTRQQYGAEGLVVSLTVTIIGLLFISMVVAAQKFENQMRVRIWSLIALAIIIYLVTSLEDVYKSKSWYGPSFYPPGDYVSGSIATDQGNNI